MVIGKRVTIRDDRCLGAREKFREAPEELAKDETDGLHVLGRAWKNQQPRDLAGVSLEQLFEHLPSSRCRKLDHHSVRLAVPRERSMDFREVHVVGAKSRLAA